MLVLVTQRDPRLVLAQCLGQAMRVFSLRAHGPRTSANLAKHELRFLGYRILATREVDAAGRTHEMWSWSNGAVRLERTLLNGVREGAWRESWREGRPALQLEFHAGRAHGPCKRWRRDGTRLCVGQYLNGRADGEWFYLHRNGKLDVARTGVYREGLRISGIKGFNEWLGSP